MPAYDIDREIMRYRQHLQMALDNLDAGMESMRPFAEAYAKHLDSLWIEKTCQPTTTNARLAVK